MVAPKSPEPSDLICLRTQDDNNVARKSVKTNNESAETKPKAATKAKGTSKAKTTTKAKSPAKAKPKSSTGGANGTKGRSLVIVESPSKAKSIGKYLGSGYVVKASMGHVRDLPEKGGLAIDVAHQYEPTYKILKGKEKTVSELKREADKADIVYLATDPDREGEAIAWHLQHALELPDERVRRVTFNEITERAVKEAFEHVGPIDQNKVNAQQARRFLDRFVGYQISPLLWEKVARTKPSLSAGRVQSVALRLLVERELEIQAFVSEEYWRITANLCPAGSTEEAERFESELAQWQGEKFSARSEDEAKAIHQALVSAPYVVSKIEQDDKSDRPDAPFKTSTLQQQASIRLRFPGKRTMSIAQELYEGIDVDGSGPTGLITYMRTDSLRVSEETIQAVRQKIESEFGDRYLPSKPNRYAAGKQAQEAHEAIRPTDLALDPEKIKHKLSHDQYRLYSLIYRRFVASQMTPAVFSVTNVEIQAGEGLFKVQGKILKFDGYRRVLGPAGKQEDALLPSLTEGQTLDLNDLRPTQHFTQPPPRFSEAALIKALEKENIGRPSTYAEIIRTIQFRRYAELKERRFHPTPLGMTVTEQLVKHFPKIMDVKFTAHMEDELDDVAQAKEDMFKVLDEFYYPFQDALKVAQERMEKVQIASSEICQDCGAPMVVKYARNGEFLSCSRYPDCKATRPLNGETRVPAIETEHKCPKCQRPLLLRKNNRGEFLACSGYPECKELFHIDDQGNPIPSVVETEHKCPKCGKIMALRRGPRGPFLGCTGYPKCRNTMPVDEQGKPIETPKVDVKCEKCGGPMGVKQGKRGAFLGCLGYPKCRSTQPIPEELKDQLGDLPAPAGGSKGLDLKTINVPATCDDCGSPMTVRRGRRGFFLGCSKYPKCKGTKEPDEATLELITAATSGGEEEQS